MAKYFNLFKMGSNSEKARQKATVMSKDEISSILNTYILGILILVLIIMFTNFGCKTKLL